MGRYGDAMVWHAVTYRQGVFAVSPLGGRYRRRQSPQAI